MKKQFEELTDAIIKKAIPSRSKASHKGNNGSVGIVGGSWIYHGAPVLAGLAALRSGADLVYLFVPNKITDAVRSISPNLIVYPLPDSRFTLGCANRLLKWLPDIDSLALGLGMVNQKLDGLEKVVTEMSVKGVNMVLDAYAIKDELVKRGKDRCVLTPHLAEFQRLVKSDVSADFNDRGKLVSSKASEIGSTIVLKGEKDIISDGKKVFVNSSGNAGMTVGGSGDVLAGIIAGLLAKGVSPLYAGAVGAYINGLAGDLAFKEKGLHLYATDIIDKIPDVMLEYDDVC